MKIRWSRPAHEDLHAILSFLSAKNPAAAGRFVRMLDAIQLRIAQFPDSGQAVEQRPGVQRIPFVRYPHILYYRVTAGELTILRIRHGAMEKPWEDVR
jgi:toxin ParE1/3/4